MLAQPMKRGLFPANTIALDLLLISLLWCLGLAITNPVGDFPLNDDWSYGRAVKTLIETGEFRPTGWVSMPLISNITWGALFCMPHGFSFSALRASTLIMSILGVLSIYILVHRPQQPRRFAVMASLTQAFNPVYWALSNTFMTDILFSTLITLSLIFFTRHFKTNRHTDLIAGSAFVLVACLSRQLAVAVPVSYLIVNLLARDRSYGRIWASALLIIACASALLLLQNWLEVRGRLPIMYHAQTEELLQTITNPQKILKAISVNIFTILMYVGLFLLPVSLVVSMQGRTLISVQNRPYILAAVFILVASGVMKHVWGGGLHSMPMGENILTQTGIGPITLRDAYFLKLEHTPSIPRIFWWAVTAASIIGAFLLLALIGQIVAALWSDIFNNKGISPDHLPSAFFLMAAVIYIMPFCLTHFFDRYFILLTPLLTASLLSTPKFINKANEACVKPWRMVSAIPLLGFFVFSVSSSHDYMNWNRERWVALNDLMHTLGASPDDIDGGFEFNGLYRYDSLYKKTDEKSWWWVKNDEYMLAFGPVPGFTALQEYKYQRYLPPSEGKIVVLKRIDATIPP